MSAGRGWTASLLLAALMAGCSATAEAPADAEAGGEDFEAPAAESSESAPSGTPADSATPSPTPATTSTPTTTPTPSPEPSEEPLSEDDMIALQAYGLATALLERPADVVEDLCAAFVAVGPEEIAAAINTDMAADERYPVAAVERAFAVVCELE